MQAPAGWRTDPIGQGQPYCLQHIASGKYLSVAPPDQEKSGAAPIPNWDTSLSAATAAVRLKGAAAAAECTSSPEGAAAEWTDGPVGSHPTGLDPAGTAEVRDRRDGNFGDGRGRDARGGRVEARRAKQAAAASGAESGGGRGGVETVRERGGAGAGEVMPSSETATAHHGHT